MPKCYRVPRLTGAVQYARQDLPAKIIVIHDSCMLALICLFGSDLPARSRECLLDKRTVIIYILVRCPCVATVYKIFNKILVHNDYRKTGTIYYRKTGVIKE
jgi:hypothetical protein